MEARFLYVFLKVGCKEILEVSRMFVDIYAKYGIQSTERNICVLMDSDTFRVC